MFMSSMESFVWCQNLETSRKKSKTYQYSDMLDEKEGRREGRGRRGRREEEDTKEEESEEEEEKEEDS